MQEVPGLALVGGDLDRAAHRRGDDAWLASVWDDPRTRVLVVHEGKARVRDDADGRPRLVLVAPAQAPPGPRFLLGVERGDSQDGADDVAYLAVSGPVAPDPASGVLVETLRSVGVLLDGREAGLLVHAVGLDNWHRTHPRCPRCGAPTEPTQAGHVRRCPEDGSLHFPRTDPAVIMVVTDGRDRCLLGRHAGSTGFTTLAGFVEPGESLEQAVAREVAEEAGLTVVEARYVASQPWPFPSSLMVGFEARVADADAHVDGHEVVEARWFTRDELRRAVETREVLLSSPVSIARTLVERWYGGALPDADRWVRRTSPAAP